MLAMWKTSKLRRRQRKNASTSSIVILNARPIVAVDRPVDDGGILIGADNPVVPLDWYPFKPSENHIHGHHGPATEYFHHNRHHIVDGSSKENDVDIIAQKRGMLHADMYQEPSRQGYRLDPFSLLTGQEVDLDLIEAPGLASAAGSLSDKSTDTDITRTIIDDGLTDWGLPKVLAEIDDEDEEADGLLNPEDAVVNSDDGWDNDQETSRQSSDDDHDRRLSRDLSSQDNDPASAKHSSDKDHSQNAHENQLESSHQRNAVAKVPASVASMITDREIELNPHSFHLGSTATMSTSQSIGSIREIEIQSVEEITDFDQHQDSFDDCLDALDTAVTTRTANKQFLRINSLVKTRLGVFVVVMYIAVFLNRNARSRAKLVKMYSKPRSRSLTGPSTSTSTSTARASSSSSAPSSSTSSPLTSRFLSKSFSSPSSPLPLPSTSSLSGIAQPRQQQKQRQLPPFPFPSQQQQRSTSSFPDWGI